MKPPISKPVEPQKATKLDVPFNNKEWRYHLCEDDLPLCSEYIQELEEANLRGHGLSFVKRKLIQPIVRLSECDRAPQLKLSDDNMTVVGDKGYSMVRATHGINRGKWYYEVYIESMRDKSAARIGWGLKYANLQAPLGYDDFGYSWRSRLGTKFHRARGYTFDEHGGYGQGDTIGCLIELPYDDANINKQHTLVHHLPPNFKNLGNLLNAKKNVPYGQRVLEEREIIPTEQDLRPAPGSKIAFYRNGTLIGEAFQNIYKGTYYPTISLYHDCKVTVNFGPTYKYPPESIPNDPNQIHEGYKDFQQVSDIEIIDNLINDLFYMIENEEDCRATTRKHIENNLPAK